MQLTDAQRMTYDTAKRFAEREIRPHVRDRANDETFPLDVMRKLADNGLLAGPFPEEYGGAGIDNVSYVLLCEAIGGASPSVFTAALTVQLSLVGTAVYNFGSEEQRSTLATGPFRRPQGRRLRPLRAERRLRPSRRRTDREA